MNCFSLQDMAGKIANEVERRKDECLDILSTLLQFETISGDESEEGRARFQREIGRCFEYIMALAKRSHMTFRSFAGKAAVAELRGSEPKAGAVGVALHLDVVPAGNGWSRPAFGGKIADGAIWGRGAQDDKGPVAMAFAAIETIKAVGLTPVKGIRLLFGTQEEIGQWEDVGLLIEKGEAPEFVVVPDGAFPIINGEKGMITIQWKSSWTIPPPGPGQIQFLSLKSGQRANMVPDLAVLRLASAASDARAIERRLDAAAKRQAEITSDLNAEIAKAEESASPSTHPKGMAVLEITFHGKSAHGAHPDAGHNAALDALEFLLLIGDWPSPLTAFAGALSERARRLDASGFGLACHHGHLGDSTANLGILEAGETGGRAEINFRFPLGLTAAHIIEHCGSLAKEASAAPTGLALESTVVGKPYEPLFVSPDEHAAYLNPLQRAYEAITGRKARLSAIAGTTYAKAYPLAVAFGPVDESAGEIEMAHKADERVTVERFLENVKIYALALALLTGAE